MSSCARAPADSANGSPSAAMSSKTSVRSTARRRTTLPPSRSGSIRMIRAPALIRSSDRPSSRGLDESAGAQYREATRAKSSADFISKIEGSLQELEESEYWLELLSESGFCAAHGVAAIKKET